MLVRDLDERREKLMDFVMVPVFQLVIVLDLVSVTEMEPG